MKNSKKNFCQDVTFRNPLERIFFFREIVRSSLEFVYRFIMRLDTNSSRRISRRISRNYHEVHSKFCHYRDWRTAKRGTWLSLQAAMKLVDIGFIMQTNAHARET